MYADWMPRVKATQEEPGKPRNLTMLFFIFCIILTALALNQGDDL